MKMVNKAEFIQYLKKLHNGIGMMIEAIETDDRKLASIASARINLAKWQEWQNGGFGLKD